VPENFDIIYGGLGQKYSMLESEEAEKLKLIENKLGQRKRTSPLEDWINSINQEIEAKNKVQ